MSIRQNLQLLTLFNFSGGVNKDFLINLQLKIVLRVIGELIIFENGKCNNIYTYYFVIVHLDYMAFAKALMVGIGMFLLLV